MKWNSVNDKLPKVKNGIDRKNCIVVYEGFVYGNGSYTNLSGKTGKKEDAFWSISHISSSVSLEVTDWILLPKPPKK